jgi:hypothetical protein
MKINPLTLFRGKLLLWRVSYGTRKDEVQQKKENSNDTHITWYLSLPPGHQQFQENDVAYFTTLNLNFGKSQRITKIIRNNTHFASDYGNQEDPIRSSNAGHITANSDTVQPGYNDIVLRKTSPVASVIPWHHLPPHY